MSDDPINALLAEDREWLEANGWRSPEATREYQVVAIPENGSVVRIVRLSSDELRDYWAEVPFRLKRDGHHIDHKAATVVLLAHTIRNDRRERVYTTRQAPGTIGRLSRSCVKRLERIARDLNSLPR